MTDASEPRPYEEIPPPRKSRRGWWILGGVVAVLLLLGTCIKGGVDVYKAVNARSEATGEIARAFMRSGLPDADDPIFSKRSGATQTAIDELNDLIALYGKASKFSDATCGMVSKAHTDAAQAGTFSSCTLTAQTRRANVSLAVDWVREEGEWKLLGFNVNYSNDAPVREREEAAAGDAEPVEAEPE